jgi:hypothetical protein
MNINTPLLSQFQAWTDNYGMMTNNSQGLSCDNGNLFTAHYTYGIVSTNQINDLEKQRLLNVYSNNFLKNGLLCRTPVFPGGRQEQDDYYGLIGAEALLSPQHRFMTRSVYNYGMVSANGIDPQESNLSLQKIIYWGVKLLTFGNCKWVYNNITPGTFSDNSWFGRFPCLIATIKMSLSESVDWFSWTYWAVCMLWSAWFGDYTGNNGDCLLLHSVNAVYGYGPITNWICNQFYFGITRKYGSAGGLMQTYFQDETNPLVDLLKNTDK